MQVHKNDGKFKGVFFNKFGKTKVSYGNGFVLYKCHLTGTKEDDLSKLKEKIATFESARHSTETIIHPEKQPGPSTLPLIHYPFATQKQPFQPRLSSLPAINYPIGSFN